MAKTFKDLGKIITDKKNKKETEDNLDKKETEDNLDKFLPQSEGDKLSFYLFLVFYKYVKSNNIGRKFKGTGWFNNNFRIEQSGDVYHLSLDKKNYEISKKGDEYKCEISSEDLIGLILKHI